ncbi:hypothetical protein [Sapientia aquatica]|uniref:Uncharacterized protein n=1 Tax=Sapientia aquatica TaxID=1549640 RepID=A0A4R5W2Z8_9BURK|nr:hypothetical protein [Sapientia aquatica]TDK67099.1 hypothetical protein E2I14_04840 [Sapientia aquatica]
MEYSDSSLFEPKTVMRVEKVKTSRQSGDVEHRELSRKIALNDQRKSDEASQEIKRAFTRY